jgi:multidrug efflux system membrane fusion protein
MNIETTEQPRFSTTPLPPTQPKPGKSRAWLWLLVLCLIGGGAYYFLAPRLGQTQSKGAKAGGQKGAARAVPVVVASARKGDMNIYLNGLGSVTAFNTVTIRTRVDGQINTVAFKEGQNVHQGDLLVEIDPRPFQLQLQSGQGQMAKDVALLNNAKVDLERYRVLLAQDAVPKQQLDTQAALVSQDEGSIKADQSLIDNARLQLVYSRITAPISGRIGLRLVDAGNMVHASDAGGLAVITQLQPIAVIFTIAEDHLPQITKKMRAGGRLAVEAYDRDMQNKLASGYLLTIDNQIDPSTGTVKCKAVFDNKNNELFPNQFVNARLMIDTLRGTIIVPTAAVQRSPDSAFVYVVKADNTVEVRNITPGQVEGDTASITDGLSAGDRVVIDGVDKLQPGALVTTGGRGAGRAGKKAGK